MQGTLPTASLSPGHFQGTSSARQHHTSQSHLHSQPRAITSPSINMPPPTIPSNRKRKSGPQPIAPAPATHSALLSRHLMQQQSSPSASISSLSVDQDQEDDEYVPKTISSTSRKSASGVIGGKRKQPSTSNGQSHNGKPTKQSREALRKANHSLIERRRREKINAALGELRRMVPGLGEDGGKTGEFKLEVLERTVAHMMNLKQHIVHLESIITQHGFNIPSMNNTSKPDDEDEDDQAGSPDGGEDFGAKDTFVGSSRIQCTRDKQNVGQSTSNQQHHQYNQQTQHRSNSHSQTMQFTNPHIQAHALSPYPSPRPDNENLNNEDPNETEPEANLPPPLTKAIRQAQSISRHASPSVASLLSQTANHSPTPPPPVSRPPPPPQSNNPIFLPFPAPSPTSPFLSGHPSTSTSASTSSSSSGLHGSGSGSYLSDPSPFLAPISGMSLFGGVFNLDLPSPADSLSQRTMRYSPPTLTLPPTNTREKLKDMPPEEAANLLLAFSSPDTLRPQVHGVPVGEEKRERRMTLDNDDFKLDSSNSPPQASIRIPNPQPATGVHKVKSDYKDADDYTQSGLKGKSAMDILKMTMSETDSRT
ncbi:hypothetical protein I203_100792 [Kwoniella mangroviensis CBS 8507]|uniref:uncharacterized protein n=1 Tax=Kwoniella mangroviensis CBS 8507 TaxID=1296122 RepID=UPI00305C748D